MTSDQHLIQVGVAHGSLKEGVTGLCQEISLWMFEVYSRYWYVLGGVCVGVGVGVCMLVCVRNRGTGQCDDHKLVNHKLTLWSPFQHPEG